MEGLAAAVGNMHLATPLVGASGTVGSVVDFASVADLSMYGAMVAKSVSEEPWTGRKAPRMAPAGTGMLNGIGIQNPGIDSWKAAIGPQIASLGVPVWGSAVGVDPDEFASVATGLEAAGVAAIEVNLSCPNLESGTMFALDQRGASEVVAAVRSAVSIAVGAKLSPNAENIVEIAAAVTSAGADWVVLGNTVWGFGIDIETRRPSLTGGVGGYSGPPIKPIALRCVYEVHRALPDVSIIGCGGISTAADVIEFLLAGASAVQIGTAHFAQPRVASAIVKDLLAYLRRHDIEQISDLMGRVQPWL